MYDKENIFFGWIYLFSFYMQTDFIYGVCLKKIMTPTPCLINQKSSDPPSINFQFDHDPPTFLPPPGDK